MPTSEARILANQANAKRSTGPKTEAGKENSRRNSLKHGLTGEGIVLPETDALEVARRTVKFAEELGSIGEVGQAFARLAALNSVRMERGADQESAALTARIRQVEADFVPPEDADEAQAAKLRDEAVRIAMFDPSREACLARSYTAAAERGFYRAVKQLRQMELQAEALIKADDAANQAANFEAMMGSIYEAHEAAQKLDDEMDSLYPELNIPPIRRPANPPYLPPAGRRVDIPMTIGQRR